MKAKKKPEEHLPVSPNIWKGELELVASEAEPEPRDENPRETIISWVGKKILDISVRSVQRQHALSQGVMCFLERYLRRGHLHIEGIEGIYIPPNTEVLWYMLLEVLNVTWVLAYKASNFNR